MAAEKELLGPPHRCDGTVTGSQRLLEQFAAEAAGHAVDEPSTVCRRHVGGKRYDDGQLGVFEMMDQECLDILLSAERGYTVENPHLPEGTMSLEMRARSGPTCA
ncbi:hypothetical protein [Actinopolymorpha pittospori]|uniref:Uncharacterized protein n=1 Tax=Actinopolymorpha pittospori TaxID=648752 RepID=A0A927MNV9_9ACTN|nr:hypothetical protein [Actinopolymorpha pittospori]MBE1604146.1 hypothetical protein [Actinopolymorpha pittospori]